MPVDEERVIKGVVLEANGGDIVTGTLVPDTRFLLQTIEIFP